MNANSLSWVQSFFGNRLIQRLTFYFLLWIVAFAIIPYSRLALIVPLMIPLLLFFFPAGFSGLIGTQDLFLFIIPGWLFYLSHAFFIFRSRHQKAFYLLLGLLGIVLALNVKGCHHVEFPNLLVGC